MIVPRSTEARDRMVAAYALRCTNDEDLAVFTAYLEQYTRAIMETTARDLLAHLGIGEGVSIEVVHLDHELREKLEQSGTLEEYLLRKEDNDS